MRNLIVSLIFFAMVAHGSAQENPLKIERDQLYQDYVNFRDTMSARTWINMVNLSKKLEAVVLFDNKMMDSLAVVPVVDSSDFEARINELTKLKEQFITDNARLNDELSRSEKSRQILMAVLIFSCFIIVNLAVFIFIFFRRNKKLMGEAEQAAAASLLLKQQHKEEIDSLKDQIEEYAGEKELMENNALEIKKSFDLYKSEQLNKAKVEPDREDIEEIRKEVEEMGNEIIKLVEERDEFEEALGMANLKLAHQIDLNRKFEAELESLLGRIRNKPSDSEDQA